MKVSCSYLGKNWPMLFTVGVVIYFALTTINFDRFIPSTPWSRDDPATDSTGAEPKTQHGPNSAALSNLRINVQSIRTNIDKKQPQHVVVDVTLEVGNETQSNVRFRPDQLALRTKGAPSTIPPIARDPRTVTISPHMPVIVPVSFQVNTATDPQYEVLYQGQRI